MRVHQIKKLLHSKETINKMRRQSMECEKIFVNHKSDKGVNIQKTQKIDTTQQKKKKKAKESWLTNGQNRQFLKQTHRGLTGCMRRCSPSLITKEMQVKTTVIWRKGKPHMHCWWECKLVQLLWKSVWRFLNKLKTQLWYDQAIPLLGIYSKKIKTLLGKIYAPTCSLQY